MLDRPGSAIGVRAEDRREGPQLGVRTLCRATGSRTAEDIAVLLGQRGGSVQFVRDLELPDQLPLSFWDLVEEDEARLVAELEEQVQRTNSRGVEADHQLRVTHDATRGLANAAVDAAAGVVVLDPGREDAGLTTVDPGTIAGRAGVPVVEVHSRTVGFSPASMLVPLVQGPHAGAALRTATVLAQRSGANLELLHLVEPGEGLQGRRAWQERLASQLAFFGGDVEAAIRVEEADDVARAVLDRGRDHDVLVLGASRKGWLARRLRGTVTETVCERTPVDALVVHTG